MKKSLGFTLIEVLLALSILAIALTAMLKASSNTVYGTQKVKENTLSHLVAMQAISMIQLNLVKMNSGQTITKQQQIFGQEWFWSATIQSTPLKKVEKITVVTRPQGRNTFGSPFIAYRTLAYE